MTPATDGVALVATQLALTDRRALSQAWYSALHLAQAQRSQPVAAKARRPADAPASRPTAPASAVSRAVKPAAVPRRKTLMRGMISGVPDPFDRRHPATDLTRRIERATTRAAAASQPSRVHAQTIDVGAGRVRLLVRSDARATRIVALCAAPMRSQVERALAHVRFRLAAAGTVVVP